MTGPNQSMTRGYAEANGTIERPDPAVEMAAFDQLPPDARRALDEAPGLFSAVAALDVYRDEGNERLMREIAESSFDWLESCEEETGIPRPTRPLRSPQSRRRRCQ